jgi:hypothetical protein
MLKKGLGNLGFPSQKNNASFSRRFRLPVAACGALLAALTAAAQTAQPPQSTADSTVSRVASLTPDTNLQAAVRSQQDKPPNFDPASLDRKRQLADESAKLLELATGLKTEVDRTTKDVLSLKVIHKASEIEQLAHNVKESTKATTGKN